MPPVNRHLDALLQLSAEERSAGAEVLLESLEDDREDDPWAAAWQVEIQQRIEENAPGFPAADVFADLRARFRAKE